MIRFSKKIEYALGTLQFLGLHQNTPISARELSIKLKIPYEFLSKTLQQLARSGIVIANYGIKGGYHLAKKPSEIHFSDIIDALDENASVVDCVDGLEASCERYNYCNIKNPLLELQSKIFELIRSTTLEDLLKDFKSTKFDVANLDC
ncbi:MAG: Rrf2 family transcriptional regulator [Ignavibacteria bacterium]|nr:Rrf2 family transcriptional regulator [Ignavibacteria bacterium]